MSEVENSPKLTSEQREQRKKMFVIYPIVALLGVFIMWLIFSPSDADRAKMQSGFNTNMPEATQNEIVENKQDAYQKDLISSKELERQQIKEMAEVMTKEQSKVETSQNRGSRTKYVSSSATPKEKVLASTEAYKDMNKTLGSFYETPKVDKEKEKMQEELDNLKAELDRNRQAAASMGVDDQIALMEKSYELAAKYMPGESNRGSDSKAAKPEEKELYVNGKAVMSVGRVDENIVSSLTITTSSNSFNTAVGDVANTSKNTISACIHSDQTIIDGGVVKIRLLEPMIAGEHHIPENAIVAGYGKIGGERLTISITSLEYQGTVIPIELSVVDSDGQVGIFIPNSMELNAAKEIIANLGTNVGTSIDVNEQDAMNEILTDLSEGAIQGVSQYVSKKIKQEKVHLKAGYKIMLYQKKQ